MNELLYKLAQPFNPAHVHFRVGATTKDKSKGIALAYLDARHIMHRLDTVVGPENWQNRYPFAGCCEIGICLDGNWIWKANGAGETDVEGEKGQYSDAFKRAGVVWGMGRYLYAMPNNWYELDQYRRFTPEATKRMRADLERFTSQVVAAMEKAHAADE